MRDYKNGYLDGTAARKLEYKPKENVKKIKKVKKNVKNKKVNKVYGFYLASIFLVFMVITYRNNLINESNMRAIDLKSKLFKVDSALAVSKINLEQNVNLDEVEAYAKQKLGMQKPSKNQIVYIDNTEKNNTIIDKTSSFFSICKEKIKEFLHIK